LGLERLALIPRAAGALADFLRVSVRNDSPAVPALGATGGDLPGIEIRSSARRRSISRGSMRNPSDLAYETRSG